MFSDVEEERLYSTGSDELDDLLERAFCEGYEYAQREFGRTGLSASQAKQFFTKVGNSKGSRSLAEKTIREGKYSPHIFGKNPTDSAIKAFRHSNSPLSMRNGSYAKDMGLDKTGKLNLKISRESNEYLRRQAGRKTNGELLTGKGTIYGGNYTS